LWIWIIASLLFAAIFIGLAYNWEWTGFGESSYTKTKGDREIRPTKTLWDWLDLLIVPGMLVFVAFWLTSVQNSNQQASQATLQRVIEEQRAQNTALQTYLDQMGNLVLEKDLANSEPAGPLQAIARAQTHTVLRSLGPEDKRIVVLFLHDSNLICAECTGQQQAVIDLFNADLEGVDLSGEIVAGASLVGAKMEHADLSNATFGNSVLGAVDLSEANVSGTNLVGTHLYGADMANANLQGADLRDATLVAVRLTGANLTNADLQGTDLSYADLRDAKVSQEQLEACKSLEGTALPNDSQPPETPPGAAESPRWRIPQFN
jgi:hypothetical protein